MSSPVSTIPNLGPASEVAFARAGIDTAEQLRALGADEAYRRLIAAGTSPHFIGFYAMVMGLQGRPWNDCRGEEKKTLRLRFDAIVASVKKPPDTALMRALDALGVVEKR
jgi:DNA transformation protein and related proteins